MKKDVKLLLSIHNYIISKFKELIVLENSLKECSDLRKISMNFEPGVTL